MFAYTFSILWLTAFRKEAIFSPNTVLSLIKESKAEKHLSFYVTGILWPGFQ